jgi:membrane protein implicated in regulation of membrane protease activity
MQNEPTTSSGKSSVVASRSSHELGDVARDVIDHVGMVARDGIKIAKLEVGRYVEHLRKDVGARALLGTGAALTAAAALVCGLVAAFLGIAYAVGVAWAFAIYCGIFAVLALFLYMLAKRPVENYTGDDIARRFPAARVKESLPEHLLVAQRSTEAGHQRMTEEAAREARIRP